MSMDRLYYLAFFIPVVIAPALLAADPDGQGVLHLDDEALQLAPWEQEYLFHALSKVNAECSDGEDAIVSAGSELVTADIDENTSITVVADSSVDSRTTAGRLVRRNGSTLKLLDDCGSQFVAPILAIIDSKQAPHSPSDVSAADKPIKDKTPNQNHEPQLSAYEENFLGWTRDDNSVNSGYMDAQISFKYRGGYFDERQKYAGFLAFTTRFSQYIQTINSSPVVGKRYNPSGFIRRYSENNQSFLDLGYAHESNGQSITTEQAYLSEREKYAQSDGEADFAKNYISRGWDYGLFNWTQCWFACEDNGTEHSNRLTTEFGYKYFLDKGLFQGRAEEYNDWEGGSPKHRKQYDGLSFSSNYRIPRCGVDGWGCSIRWDYTTGYDGIFDQSTNRIQVTVDPFKIIPCTSIFTPSIGIWVQTGHNSSLATYYEGEDSIGLALIFSDPYSRTEKN